MNRLTPVVFLVLVSFCWTHAQEGRRQLGPANRLLEQGRFSEAEVTHGNLRSTLLPSSAARPMQSSEPATHTS